MFPPHPVQHPSQSLHKVEKVPTVDQGGERGSGHKVSQKTSSVWRGQTEGE